MGEGEAGEAAGDRCQSVIGLGKGRARHGLGTGTGWTGHGHGRDWARARACWARAGHGQAEHGRIVSERHRYTLVNHKGTISHGAHDISLCTMTKLWNPTPH